MIRSVFQYPNSILREVCIPVDAVSTCQILISDMIETLQKSNGLGLAANQIGESVRIIIFRSISNPNQFSVLVNPIIVGKSGESNLDEGCLSLPGYRTRIKRYEKVTVEALDRDGQQVTYTEDGLSAVILQHEIDHLDGKLLIDHLGPVRKSMFKAKWEKLQKKMSRKK
jgi:peptide deformylase